MTWQRDPLSVVIQRAKTDLSDKLQRTGAWLRRSVSEVLATVLAKAVNGLYGRIETEAKNLFTDTASEEHVRREAAQYGLSPTAAVKATGYVSVTGTGFIEADTVLQRADDAEFVTTADIELDDETADVAVIASVEGTAGNTAAGAPLAFVSPVAGIASSGNVAVGGLTGGLDEEGWESLKTRLLERKANPPQGGSEADYKRWVREVFPSAQVFVYPLLMGPRSVGITFILPNRADIIPTEDDIEAVRAYLEPRRPVTAQIDLFAPEANVVNMTMWSRPATAPVRAAIEAELTDVFIRSAEPGGTTRLSHLDEAASIAAGEEDHGITTPVADIVAPAGSVNVLGVITWVPAP
ncbi:baseplate J/gp47 family protein [Asticcacaulis sp. YBE204]|uniref:baseplate J/gp47 family protein n=1 Tax=Asticcacaulis sp. YBE204 TaxID=1282363 RepID=UPI0003C40690|nr:baseplate J/gp47 family protein [Asticcacaulis sp. YBE204]ESQ78520.1 hypothetical protein AEYBE204_13295 [Asticcacaulis sp. YBE204]